MDTPIKLVRIRITNLLFFLQISLVISSCQLRKKEAIAGYWKITTPIISGNLFLPDTLALVSYEPMQRTYPLIYKPSMEFARRMHKNAYHFRSNRQSFVFCSAPLVDSLKDMYGDTVTYMGKWKLTDAGTRMKLHHIYSSEDWYRILPKTSPLKIHMNYTIQLISKENLILVKVK
jgi:hypothetical protein